MFAPALLEAVREVEEEENDRQQQHPTTHPQLPTFPSLPRFTTPSFAPPLSHLPPAVPLAFSSAFFSPPPVVPLSALPPPLPSASTTHTRPFLPHPVVALTKPPALSQSPPTRKPRTLKAQPSPVLSIKRRGRPPKQRSASKEREAEVWVPQSPHSVTSVASSAPSTPLSGSVLLPFTVEEDDVFMEEQRREAGEVLAGVGRGGDDEDEEDQRTCRYDSESFGSVGDFIEHLKRVHSMTLSQYNKAKTAAQAAKKPRQSTQQKRTAVQQRKKNEHQCELCGKSFTSLQRLSDHYQHHEAAFQQEDKVKAKQKKGGSGSGSGSTASSALPASPLVTASKPRVHLVSRLPLPPPPAEEGDEEDTVCAVCLSGESTDENLIMFCDGPCRLAYHQECIGADYVPEGDWFCSERCERGEEMSDMARWVRDRRDEYERRQRERIAAQQQGGPRETDPAVLMLKGFWEEVDGYFSMRGMVEGRELLEESMLDESLMAPVERGRPYREQWADEDAREEEELRGAFGGGGSSRRRKSAAEAAAQKAKSMEESEEDDEDEDEEEEEEEVEEIQQDESMMTKDEIAEKRKKEKLRKALSYEHSSERNKRVKKKGRKEPAIRLSLYAQISAKPSNAASSSSSSSATSSQVDMVLESPLSSPILSPQSSPLSSELPSSPLPVMGEEEPPSRTLSSPVPISVRIDGIADASSFSSSSMQPLSARSKSDGAALSLSLPASVSSASAPRPSPLVPPSTNGSAAAAHAPSPSQQGGKQPRSALSLSSPHPSSNKAPRATNTTGGKAPRTNNTSLSSSTNTTDTAMADISHTTADSSAPIPSSLALPSSTPRGKGPVTPLGKHHHPMPASHQSTKAPHTSAPSLTTSNEDELREPVTALPAPFFALRSLEGDYMRSVGFRVSAARLSEARETGAGYVFPPFVYDPHSQTMEGGHHEKDDEEESDEAELSKEERRTRRRRDKAGVSGLELDIVSLARHEPSATRSTAVEVPSALEPKTAPTSPRTPHSLTQRPSRPRSGSVPSTSSLHLFNSMTRASVPVVPLAPLDAAGAPLLVPLGPAVSSSGRPIRLTTRALSSSAFKPPPLTTTPTPIPPPPAPLIELLPTVDTDEVANELWLCQQSYLVQHGHNEHIKHKLHTTVTTQLQHFLTANNLPTTFTSPTSQPTLLRVLWERRRTEREVLDYFAENWLSSKAWKEYTVQVEEAEERGDEATAAGGDDVDDADDEMRREHRKLRRADRIVAKVVSEMVSAVGKAVKQGKDDQRLRHRQERAERKARKKEEQIARRVKGCMDWMLGKIVAKEELRERRERIRRMGEEEQRKELEKEKERRRERRRRRKLKKREKKRAKKEKERRRMAKMMRRKERERKKRRKEKERQKRLQKEAEEEEERQRRRRREKKRRRRKAESSTSESSSSSDDSAEQSSDSERSVSSASDSERSEEEKVSSSSSSSSDGEKAEAQEVYCYCRQPMIEHVPMICCSVCGEWYHGKCVSLTGTEMDNIDDYVCSKCEQHGERRTTYFTQKNDDILIDQQHSHVPAIRLKRVGVVNIAPAAVAAPADVDSQQEAVSDTASKSEEQKDVAAMETRVHTRVLYEVVSNEGVALAEEAEDELLSQPLSIHRAASLKLRLRKQHSEGRASRRGQQLWRVTRVVGKNVYWARESGLNWHYIRETNISSKDKRWIDAPGVEKTYAEEGTWLIHAHERRVKAEDEEGSVKIETDEECGAARDAVGMEADGEVAEQQPKAVVPKRSHKKQPAPKKSHKRKVVDEPTENNAAVQADGVEVKAEDEPSNLPVESVEPLPPPAPKVRRPPAKRMSEAQRLLTTYLESPTTSDLDDADDGTQADEEEEKEEEAQSIKQEKPAVEADESDGRRRSSRRQPAAVMVDEEPVAEGAAEEEEEEEEAVQETPTVSLRRSSRSQATTRASDSASSSRASSTPASPVPTLVSTGRTTRRSAAATSPVTDTQATMSVDDSNSRSSRGREKRKQLSDNNHSGATQTHSDDTAVSPHRNGLHGKPSRTSNAAATHQPPSPSQSQSASSAQRSKRQRRNGDLELIDSAQIFAQRSRRGATAHHTHNNHSTAEENGTGKEEEQEEEEGEEETEQIADEADDQANDAAELVGWEDERRRSTRMKASSPGQSTAAAAPSQRVSSSGRKVRQVQAKLQNYFTR